MGIGRIAKSASVCSYELPANPCFTPDTQVLFIKRFITRDLLRRQEVMGIIDRAPTLDAAVLSLLVAAKQSDSLDLYLSQLDARSLYVAQQGGDHAALTEYAAYLDEQRARFPR